MALDALVMIFPG